MLSRMGLGILAIALVLAMQGAYADEPDPNTATDPNDPNMVVLPSPLGSALGLVADDLVAGQIVKSNYPGTGWPGMQGYDGAITLGMVSAYNIFGSNSYGSSAVSGAGWLYHLSIVQTPYGDGVLAWDALGKSGFNGSIGVWSDTTASFFDLVKVYTPGGAASYAASFGGDTSSTVYYLSNLTLAAYGVNAPEKAIWRQGLIDALSTVNDDSAVFPVQAIGIATWALATTGPLDATLVWDGVALSDLPGVLVSHQVSPDGFDPGSFFWRIDHTGSDANLVAEGYTQDAIFATLGLFAAADTNPDIVPALQAPIVNALKAVLGTLGDDGLVYEHLSLGGESSYVYAAQMLLLADVVGLGLDVDLNVLDGASTYEDLGIAIEGPLVWNPSFELPGTAKQKNFENVVGWTSGEGVVTDSGVEAGWSATDGDWTAFLRSTDPGVYQVTHHEIAADDIIQLSVDARITWAATTMLMELFYVDGAGDMVSVASSEVALTDDMANYSLVFVAADDPNAVGQRLGLLFDNVSPDDSWIGLDNVNIDFLAEVPVVVVDDPNAGL